MPVFDPTEKPIPALPFILLSNLFPLTGVLFYNMSFFALFYLFWWETVLISFYQWLKMNKAERRDEPDPNFRINGYTLTHEQVNSKKYMRRMYAITRIAMLLFYLLFIVVFVGIYTTSESVFQEEMISVGGALVFADHWMRISFILFIIVHGVDYVNYIITKQYQETSLRQLGMPFDGRIIIIHVVIVLGTFLSIYFSEKLMPGNPKAGNIAFASLFVLLKTIVDVIAYRKLQRRSETMISVYNRMQKK